jgi:hypothetical protein
MRCAAGKLQVHLQARSAGYPGVRVLPFRLQACGADSLIPLYLGQNMIQVFEKIVPYYKYVYILRKMF